MKQVLTVALLGAALAPGAAHAVSLTLDVFGPALATDVSADGSVVVGNMPDTYESFRWTAADGVVRLGRSTLTALGTASGLPGVSADGTRVSATILSDDGTYGTQGLWTQGTGWVECMPLPPDGGQLDNEVSSAYGLSKDGTTVVGLYWRPGAADGSAHASSWTAAGGMLDLGTQIRSGRANACSGTGATAVGWTEDPTGAWQPTVWENGTVTVLNHTAASCEARSITADGSMIVGYTYDPPTFSRLAAYWTRSDSGWVESRIGVLPGTRQGDGFAIANDVTADGRVVVGYNTTRSFGGAQTGFVWTPTAGMVDIEKALNFFGYPVAKKLDITSLAAISDDGTTLVGYGYQTKAPFAGMTFVVHVANLEAALAQYVAATRGVSKTATPRVATTSVAAAGPVDLGIFDCTGKQVDAVSRVERTDTGYRLAWRGVTQAGTAVSRGVYYARPLHGAAGPVQRIVVTR